MMILCGKCPSRPECSLCELVPNESLRTKARILITDGAAEEELMGVLGCSAERTLEIIDAVQNKTNDSCSISNLIS